MRPCQDACVHLPIPSAVGCPNQPAGLDGLYRTVCHRKPFYPPFLYIKALVHCRRFTVV